MRRLIWVASLTGATALILSILPGGDSESESTGATPHPVFKTEIELGSEGILPYRVQVPKDHEIHLLVRGASDAVEGVFSITGYEDQVSPVLVGPGLSREIVFTSRRPGDDFAFMLNGEMLGRLEVTGSHLEEGHQ